MNSTNIINRIAKIASSKYWEMPPDVIGTSKNDLENWVSNNYLDAVAYAAGWTQYGIGHGFSQSRSTWPDNPGFDWEDGISTWGGNKEKEEEGYEYRTILMYGDSYSGGAPNETADGFKLVEVLGISPELDVYDEEGDLIGPSYIGEGNIEATYKRHLEDDIDSIVEHTNKTSSSDEVDWEYPPLDNVDNEPIILHNWAHYHKKDLVAYAARWTQDGIGHGPINADIEWPDNPGFDWQSGIFNSKVNLKTHGLNIPDFEYRTVLSIGDVPTETEDGFKLVRRGLINPMIKIYDGNGDYYTSIFVDGNPSESVYSRHSEDLGYA